MMGIQKSDNSLFCYKVNLNARLPENHYLKKIDKTKNHVIIEIRIS